MLEEFDLDLPLHQRAVKGAAALDGSAEIGMACRAEQDDHEQKRQELGDDEDVRGERGAVRDHQAFQLSMSAPSVGD